MKQSPLSKSLKNQQIKDSKSISDGQLNGASVRQDSSSRKLIITKSAATDLQVLKHLLGKTKPVNFHKLAEKDPETNLSLEEYQIYVVQELLLYANREGFGFRCVHQTLFLFNGSYWQIVEPGLIKKFLEGTALKMGVSANIAKHFRFADNLYKQLEHQAFAKTGRRNGKIVINLLNGTFEVKDKVLRPFDKKDFLTYQLPFRYDQQAKAPIFYRYLDRVLPDKQSQKMLSEFVASIFVPPTQLKLEKVLLLYGSGANGKSVFFDIVNALLGRENISTFSLCDLTSKDGRDRALIENKLLNYGSEINGNLESDIFKQLASGKYRVLDVQALGRKTPL